MTPPSLSAIFFRKSVPSCADAALRAGIMPGVAAGRTSWRATGGRGRATSGIGWGASDQPQGISDAGQAERKVQNVLTNRNCRSAAAPSRRPPSGLKATRQWPPAPRDIRPSSKIPVGHRNVPKYAEVKAGFREEVPPTSTRNRGFPAFFSGPLCHIGSPARLFVTDDTRKCPQAPPPAPKWRSN